MSAPRPLSALLVILACFAGTSSAAPSKPKIVEAAPPIYPESSRRAQEHGDVLVRVLVSQQGRPLDVTLARSSGYPALDAAALEAVKLWKYAPATDDAGKAIDAQTQFNVRFQLDDSPPPPPAFDAETRAKIENEWYSLIDLSVIVDRTWRRCRSLSEPGSSVEKFRDFYEALAPEISARESYLHLYFKDHPKDQVERMIRFEKQGSAAAIAYFIENATLNQKSPKTWCEPLMAESQAAMNQFMRSKEVDWAAPDLRIIRALHTPRRKLMEPRR
ncbi:MAG TPA: energy transducer TonB [Steroidobacteraceae bacterium]|nr:energy transducer TonB [Steroidobacteraceae bacterium]